MHLHPATTSCDSLATLRCDSKREMLHTQNVRRIRPTVVFPDSGLAQARLLRKGEGRVQ